MGLSGISQADADAVLTAVTRMAHEKGLPVESVEFSSEAETEEVDRLPRGPGPVLIVTGSDHLLQQDVFILVADALRLVNSSAVPIHPTTME